jgi:hypothetical protein
MKRFLTALFVVLLMATSVHAANIISSEGATDSNGIPAAAGYDDTTFSVIRNAYEVATTSDTLTAQESGKVIAVNPENAGVTFTLPTAAPGMSFKFVQTAGHANGSKKFIVNPQDTDYLVGVVNSTSTSTFAAGDAAISPGATGDSITVFCATANYWNVIDRTGTFVDNN